MADTQAPSQTLSLRLRSAVDESRLTIGMAFAVVLLSCALLWDSVDHWHLGAWGLILGLLYSVRLGFNIAYHRRVVRPEPMDERRWAALLYLQLGVAGLAWSVLYWLLAQLGVELRLTSAALLMAVAGVSLGALFTLPLGYALFAAGLLLPPAASLLLFERSPNFLLAMTLIGYWAAMVLLARRSSSMFTQRALAQMAQARALTLHQALLALRQRDFTDLAGLMRAATETAARALSAQRVGVWRVAPMQADLTCADLFRADANQHEQGARIVASRHPGYFAALGKGELMAAGDASADPRTSEFLEDPARPSGKAARLDAPLCLGSRLEGMLRFERIGTLADWSQEEQDFALALASHLMHAIDQDARLQAEFALRESERRMVTLLAHLPGEAYRCRNDPGWTLEFASQGILALTGHAPEAFLGGGLAFGDLIDPQDRDRVWRETQQALQQHEAFALEYRIHGADGAEKWVLERGTGVYRQDGTVEAIEGFIIDNTEFKRASEALRRQSERLALAQRAARMIVADWDVERDQFEWSDSPEWLRGPLPAATGKYPTYKDQVHPDDRDAFLAARAVALETMQGPTIEHRLIRTDGQTLWLRNSHVVVAARSPGGATRLIAAVYDITERKLAELALQDLNQSLEQRIEQRTAELRDSEVQLRASINQLSLAKAQVQQANQELEHRVALRTAELAYAMREMEAVSYSISHDLRGPLRAMSGFSSILLEQHSSALPEDGRMLLQRVRSAALRMGTMIDALLDLARVAGVELRPEPVDLAQLARELWAEAADAGRASEAAFSAPASCLADCDPLLMRNVLHNLLENAIKYSHGTPNAKVEFGQTDQANQRVFFVCDNGAGFDMAHAGRLFQAFQRLHPAKKFEGTGVGLVTVRRIVERHGGRIWAEASPGQGACFYFTLGAPAP